MNTQRMSQTFSKTSVSYCRFGAETLLKLLEGTDNLIDGVIENKDIEYVHKTRVSSRRLRAALPIFYSCYPKKTFEIWLDEIKKVTRLLATARDLDVQIVFLEQYMKKLDSTTEKNVITTFLRSHRTSRKRAQTAVAAGIEELKKAGTLRQIKDYCTQTLSEQTPQPFRACDVLEQARWHTTSRLDDFLSMEKYVYQEKKKLKHHQMRIYAKKLRYTLECFAPLYDNKLNEEIATMKEFQDVLGEMHDSDVWLEAISLQMQKNQTKTNTKTEDNQALRNFADYVAGRRKKSYSQFTKLWTNKRETGFFSQLRKKTEAELMTQNLNHAVETLKNPKLKVAVISDVHANLQALQQVLKDAEERGAEVFLNAGDSVGFGASPNESIQLICEKKILSVAGNFDLEVLEGTGDAKGEKKCSYKFAERKLSKAAKDYLKGLPKELRLNVSGRKLLLTHGAPGNIEKHLLPDTSPEELQEIAKQAKADLIVVGHSHEQFWRQLGKVDFINPGSVGRPGDGNPKAAYAMLSFKPFKVEQIRLGYDVEESVETLRKERLPESYAQMLLSGVSLDFILKEDHTRYQTALKNQEVTVKTCEEFAALVWPDTEHSQQVTGLALALFDALLGVHKLGERERFWLRCAAILHDVGLSKSSSKHHKESAQIILNAAKLPFSSKERRVIACIARYHRRALPKPKHAHIAALDRTLVEKVCVLSAILRVADSLDYSHQAAVKLLGVNVGAKKISVECVSNSDLTQEQLAFDKKKDLFEKVFKKRMMLEWKGQKKPLSA